MLFTDYAASRSATLQILVWFIILSSNAGAENFSQFHKYCMERYSLLTGSDDSSIKLVVANLGTDLILECHYCNSDDDDLPKVWYYQNISLTDSLSEIIPDTKNNESLNRIIVTNDHSLILKNFTRESMGLYYCHSADGQDSSKYNYFIDMESERNVSLITGNISSLVSFQEMYVAPVNSLLESYMESGRLSKNDQKVEMQVQLEWSEWGPCYNCYNSSGERNKTANCRVRLLVRNDRTQFLHTKEVPAGNTNETVIWKLLYKVRELSCRSVMLLSYLPFIANATGIIPEFVTVEMCVELCLKEDVGDEVEHSTIRTQKKRRVVMKEGTYTSLPCPGVNANTVVMWRKDGKEIAEEKNEETDLENENPHIAIDSFGTLYISEAAENDSGHYICFADKKKVQEIIVNVISDTKEMVQYILQHMTYLLFIFFLCFIFYCAGLFIACSNRRQFVQYTPLETEAEN